MIGKIITPRNNMILLLNGADTTGAETTQSIWGSSYVTLIPSHIKVNEEASSVRVGRKHCDSRGGRKEREIRLGVQFKNRVKCG